MKIDIFKNIDNDSITVNSILTMGEVLNNGDGQSAIILRVIEKVSEAISLRVLDILEKEIDLREENYTKESLYWRIKAEISDKIVVSGEEKFTQAVLAKIDLQALVNSTFIALISKISEVPTRRTY